MTGSERKWWGHHGGAGGKGGRREERLGHCTRGPPLGLPLGLGGSLGSSRVSKLKAWPPASWAGFAGHSHSLRPQLEEATAAPSWIPVPDGQEPHTAAVFLGNPELVEPPHSVRSKSERFSPQGRGARGCQVQTYIVSWPTGSARGVEPFPNHMPFGKFLNITTSQFPHRSITRI